MHMWLHGFDMSVTQLIQSLPDWVAFVMHAASFIGQPLITIPLAAGVIWYGVYRRNRRVAVAGIVALATFTLNSILKLLIQRDRPEMADLLAIHSYSFPSGHASSTLVIFGLLAVIAWQVLPRLRGYIAVSMISLLIVLVGVSRIYLGVHYPTDVLAGWIVGGTGLLAILVLVRPRL